MPNNLPYGADTIVIPFTIRPSSGSNRPAQDQGGSSSTIPQQQPRPADGGQGGNQPNPID